MRLWLPDGYKIPPHWHPKVEHVTVISGIFNLGMGEKFDKAPTREMPAGILGGTDETLCLGKGDTVVQLHGVGPWSINYVNAPDDLRIKNR